MRFASYVICGTPRSGSTLLCDLLTATGIAGCPASFYRGRDIPHWARRWGVRQAVDLRDPEFARAYLAAMLRAGRGPSMVFGLRLMWDGVPLMLEHLRTASRDGADVVDLLAAAYGPTLLVHLSRVDKVAQAISLVRAEQSGLWHRNPDGTERERTAPPREPHYDPQRIALARDELTRDDAAWADFFDRHALVPLRVTYEALAASPEISVSSILRGLGLEPEGRAAPSIGTAKMADDVSSRWSERFRREQAEGTRARESSFPERSVL